MNPKWYISTLVLILALVGFNQKQAKKANQQIIVQFADAETVYNVSHNDAVTTITKRLKALGIDNIEVTEEGGARFSIRYYSVTNARSVGRFLSQDAELPLVFYDVEGVPTDVPSEKLPETCSLQVLDLQQQSDAGLGLNGKFAVEVYQNFQRFANPSVSQVSEVMLLRSDVLVDVALKTNYDVELRIENTSQIIPEVRAGPYVHGNS